MAGTSRVNREIYARFCGGLVVKFLRPTRREVTKDHDSNTMFEVRAPPWMARCREGLGVPVAMDGEKGPKIRTIWVSPKPRMAGSDQRSEAYSTRVVND